jgi:hypothetical protein
MRDPNLPRYTETSETGEPIGICPACRRKKKDGRKNGNNGDNREDKIINKQYDYHPGWSLKAMDKKTK